MTSMEKKNEQTISPPYRFGKSTFAWTEFFAKGKAGESIALACPEGNFLSPKAVENVLKAKEREVLEEVGKIVSENLSKPESTTFDVAWNNATKRIQRKLTSRLAALGEGK